MQTEKNKKKKLVIRSLKIAIGSFIAIDIATLMGLQFATSAGIIALLSIVTTKWETVKLSAFRIVTFFMSVIFCCLIFLNIKSDWMAYGLFIFLLVIISESMKWKNTISVNAVVGTHFLTTHDFSLSSIMNEFLLVLIGISIAILFNLFQNNGNTKKKIIDNMQKAEERLQIICDELAGYLANRPMNRNVWDDIIALEGELEIYIEEAYEYQDNTFYSHPSYYIHYFEMRSMQCSILHNLHYEMKKIRNLPKQAHIISDYIMYLKDYIKEKNEPKQQIDKLEQLFEEMRQDELPKTREEFESRAMLYHILMDLEEFLVLKKRFVESMDDKQHMIYWRKENSYAEGVGKTQ